MTMKMNTKFTLAKIMEFRNWSPLTTFPPDENGKRSLFAPHRRMGVIDKYIIMEIAWLRSLKKKNLQSEREEKTGKVKKGQKSDTTRAEKFQSYSLNKTCKRVAGQCATNLNCLRR